MQKKNKIKFLAWWIFTKTVLIIVKITIRNFPVTRKIKFKQK